MTIFFILLGLIAVILLLLFFALGSKRVVDASRKEKEEMIKQIYQYAVAFITLIMVIGGGVSAFMAAADYISPNTYIQTYEEYKSMKIDDAKFQDKELNADTNNSELTEEEIKAQYDAMVEQQTNKAKQRAINNLIKSFGWIIIPLPIYIYFQRRIQQTRKE